MPDDPRASGDGQSGENLSAEHAQDTMSLLGSGWKTRGKKHCRSWNFRPESLWPGFSCF